MRVVLLCALVALGCEPEHVPDVSGSTGEPELREIALLEPVAGSPSGSLFSAASPTVREVLVQLESAAEASDCRGVFLRLGPMGGGFGHVADLGEGLAAIRDAGKPIHCHFDAADNASYALMATWCDRITMGPAGLLNLVGVAAQVFYARSLLDRIGAHADILHMGRYKGTGDTLTREDIPPETRESLGALLDDMDAVLVAAVGRRSEDVRAALDGGPYTAIRARDAGLVDAVAFDDTARESARQAAGAPDVRAIHLGPTTEPVSLTDILGALGGSESEPATSGPRVALVYLAGSIVDGETPRAGQARSGPFVAAARRLQDDDSVKAVVLRVDSPGGSALASDRMWRAIQQLAEHKPVIASVGDVAASGGYYIASAADLILAHDASIVGSIGVVGGKVSFGDLADSMGVNDVVLTRGRNAAWTSPLRRFTPSEEEAVQAMLSSTYYRFVRRVAEGRGVDQSAVLVAAEGRVMSGRAGITLGLVDRIGGLREALREARERGGLEADSAVEVWPADVGLLQSILGAAGGAQTARASLAELMIPLGPIGEAAALLPVLLEGEAVAVALPFVLQIQ